jgi:hypothetical protein
LLEISADRLTIEILSTKQTYDILQPLQNSSVCRQ